MGLTKLLNMSFTEAMILERGLENSSEKELLKLKFKENKGKHTVHSDIYYMSREAMKVMDLK